MKVKTRAADGLQVPDCGHPVAPGRVVVRRGRHWVCVWCSLPPGTTWAPPKCGACGEPMSLGDRIALHPGGRWCHQGCVTGPVLALTVVSEGQ